MCISGGDMYLGNNSDSMILGIIVLFVVLFFACRELFCWYWKQTEQVKLLKEIRDLLKYPVKESVDNTGRCQACCRREFKKISNWCLPFFPSESEKISWNPQKFLMSSDELVGAHSRPRESFASCSHRF